MRFEDVDDKVYEILGQVRDQHFSDLQNAKIKCLYDLKKRTRGGKVVLAAIRKTNDLLKHLTAEEAKNEEGFNYIIFIDKVAWENIDDKDRVRLLRHELRHTNVEIDDVKDPYQLVAHDIEDFIQEVDLNKDDVGWAKRVATLTADIYAQLKEQEKAAKKKSKKRR